MQKPEAGKKKKKVLHETHRTIYKGARKRKGKWVSELQQPHNKSRVWLGIAAIAHDVSALALMGDESASLNFPEVAPTVPRLDSFISVRDIQHAGTKAARKYCGTVKTFASSYDGECESSCSSTTAFSPGQDYSEKSDRSLFWDEEEVFNMPVLMNSMAEGLIITPPALQNGFNWVDIETTIDLSLW